MRSFTEMEIELAWVNNVDIESESITPLKNGSSNPMQWARSTPNRPAEVLLVDITFARKVVCVIDESEARVRVNRRESIHDRGTNQDQDHVDRVAGISTPR